MDCYPPHLSLRSEGHVQAWYLSPPLRRRVAGDRSAATAAAIRMTPSAAAAINGAVTVRQ